MCKKLKLIGYLCFFFWGVSPVAFSHAGESSLEVPLPELIIGPPEDPIQKTDFFEGSRDTLLISPGPSKNLSEILDSNPKIQVTPQGSLGDPPRFFLRGMDQLQTRFFLEEIPMSEPVFQSNALLFVPTYAFGRVEIFPSAAPTSYLRSSLGGAVNVRIPRPSNSTSFQTELGSFGFFKGGVRSSLFKNVQLAADYIQSQEDFSFLDNNGTPWNPSDDQLKTRENNSFRRLTLMPFWDWTQKNGLRWTVFSLNGFQKKMTPGSVEKPEVHQLDEWNHLSAIKLRVPLETQWVLENSAYFRHNKELLTPQKLHLNQDSRNSSLGGKIAILFREVGWDSRLSLGFEASHFTLEEPDRNYEIKKISQMEAPVSISNVFELGTQTFLNPSWLGILSQSPTNPQEAWKLHSSFRLGFEHSLSSQIKVRAFAANMFRLPTFSERFGLQPGMVGNPLLQNETALKADLGIVWESGSRENEGIQQLTYNLFGSQAKNLIVYLQNSPNTHQPENLSSADWVGQEVGITYALNWGFSFQPSLVWMWTRNNSSLSVEEGKSLPHLAPWRSKVTTFWKRGIWFVTHHLVYCSETFTDKANQQKSESFMTQDVSLGLSNKEWGRVELKILNVLDTNLARVSVLGVETNQYVGGGFDYPSFGRRVSLSWSLDL